MSATNPFPLHGVIGVVANFADEIQLAVDNSLACIELRADLLLDAGLNETQLFNTVKLAKSKGLSVLFTLRHPTHGGKFKGSESARVSLSRQALEAGADLFDLEWGTQAAADAQDLKHLMILSHHDFNAMPDSQELQKLTAEMQGSGARAIKVVPTAGSLEDAVTMLRWVGEANGQVKRIGFAMGETGACSRILTTAYGGPITYASFGEAVAPGQIPIDALLARYRVAQLNGDTAVIAVCGDEQARQLREAELNKQFIAERSNRVAIGFASQDKTGLSQFQSDLRLVEIETV